MKYIRTKDGRIINIRYALEDKEKIYDYGWNDEIIIHAYKCDIIKQADTIEELCDEFVSVRDNWHDLWDNFIEPSIICSESDIYGAIWTDKGLIYVAQANDKGGWELL